MPLELQGFVDLPTHATGGFDHGDVDLVTGRVFIAHTANGTVEVVDGVGNTYLTTIAGCPEASGVLCVQGDSLTFAAARGAGKVLVIESATARCVRELAVGPKPNGLAWDGERRLLLVADVADHQARVIDPTNGQTVATAELSGRPRWCVYDRQGDRFLINIREPASVEVLSAATMTRLDTFPVDAAGPHGLDLDEYNGRALVACDGSIVAAIDLQSGQTVGTTPIAGAPDAIWHNRSRQRLYVAIGHPGVVDVVDTGTSEVVEEIATEEGAHTTAFDSVRQKLYVFLPRSCRVAVYAER